MRTSILLIVAVRDLSNRTVSISTIILLTGALAGTLACFASFMPVHAQERSQPGQEKSLVVTISLDLPPYVFDHATRGLEVDLVHSALTGYTLKFVQMPYEDLQSAISNKQADVSVGVQLADDGVYYSDNFLTFHNAAITKKSDDIEINDVAALQNHPVLTWQNAYLELGNEFRRLFSPNSPQRKNYHEIADQRRQVQMFWQINGQVIVIDEYIFEYFSREMGHTMDEVDIYSVFPPATDFRVGFRNAALRDAFDRRLNEMCANGDYAAAMERYHISLEGNVCDQRAVRSAMADYYRALNAIFNGEMGPMENVWSHESDVIYMGPDGGVDVGWEQVRANWQRQAKMKRGGQVHPQSTHIALGRDLAVVQNSVKGQNRDANGKTVEISIRSTHVFRQEAGRWKLVGVHADPLPFLEKLGGGE